MTDDTAASVLKTCTRCLQVCHLRHRHHAGARLNGGRYIDHVAAVLSHWCEMKLRCWGKKRLSRLVDDMVTFVTTILGVTDTPGILCFTAAQPYDGTR